MSKLITLNLPDDWVNQIDTVANHMNKTRAQLIRAVLKKQLNLSDNKVSIGRPTKTKAE